MDIDEVEYSDSPLAEISIWRSTFSSSGGMYSENLSASFEDLTQSTDLSIPTSLLPSDPSS